MGLAFSRERNRRRRLVDPSLAEMTGWFDTVEEESVVRTERHRAKNNEQSIKLRFALGVVVGYLVAKKIAIRRR